MITHVGTAMLYVADQQVSLRFYRDVLGFSVVSDENMGGGFRWLELAPPDGSTTIALHNADSAGKEAGEGAYLTFACDDIWATVDELRTRGAKVTDPDEQSWGAYAFIDGPDGHQVQIHQK